LAGALTIINQPGPLPLKATFNAPSDGPVIFVVSGSAWSATANTPVGATILLDGKPIGNVQVWSNGTGTHRALVTQFIPTQTTFGQHTITLQALNSHTVTDLNDPFQVTLLY